MVIHEQQDGNAGAPCATGAMAPLTPSGASRRRIAGLAVSGVVMTVASSHAMASLVCISPSGALSGNLNSQSPNVVCEGRSPGYWKNHLLSWPAEVRSSDLFSRFFICHGPLASATCLQMLQGHKSDKHNVAMHIMATYLNVATGRTTFLTRQAVLDMWAQWEDNGSYTPALGVAPWSGKELTDYLSSTQS